MAFQYLKGAYKQEGKWLFTRVSCARTRRNDFSTKHGRTRLDIGNQFFTIRVVKHWHRLPKEVVDSPSLEAFKARPDVALRSLAWWLVTLHVARGLKLDDHDGPFQLRPFYDSMIRCIKKSVASRSNEVISNLLCPAEAKSGVL